MTWRAQSTIKGYFLFYAVTFFGSAITSVSSFLVIERLVGSVSGLGLALALKTASSALAAPVVGRYLSKTPIKTGLIISQLIGLLLLIPLYLGMKLQSPTLFISGIAIGGLSGLILNILGTAHLKLASEENDQDFRANQGRLQLVIGLTFTACSICAPYLLSHYSFDSVLFLDVVTYVVAIVYVYVNRSLFEHPARLAPFNQSDLGAPPLGPKRLLTNTNAVFAMVVSAAYALKGLPPLLSGNGRLTADLGLDIVARQRLWALEAAAGIAGGYIYQKAHKRLARLSIFELGLLNSAFLIPFVIAPTYATLAFAIFALSLSMLLTFMKFRDDFLSHFRSQSEAVWASAYVNLVLNVVLTASPLAISLCANYLGLYTSITVVLGLQGLVYFYSVTSHARPHQTPELSNRLKKGGSKVIGVFLVSTCILLTLILQSTERRRAQQQTDIWVQSVTKSIVPQLVQNDYVPIFGKLRLVQKTGLFREFAIYDSNRKLIASLNPNPSGVDTLTAVTDDAGSTWGYYAYASDPSYWYSSLTLVLPIILCTVGMIAVIARQFFYSSIKSELERVENFITAMERRSARLDADLERSEYPLTARDGDSTEIGRIRKVVIGLVKQVQSEQGRLFDHKLAIARSHEQAEISKQVAHDIRSPLSVLNLTVSRLNGVDSERKELITTAVARINQIADDY